MGVSACASPLSMASPNNNNAATNMENNSSTKPRWVPDAARDACLCCGKSFSIWTRRRHHCRACGELVCAECSPFSSPIPELGYKDPVRMCKDCKPTSSCSATSPTMTLDGSSSESSDGEMGDLEDELVFHAVDVIASHSTHKQSRLQYQYFVQSEAVSWLNDAGVMKNRSSCAALFTRLVDEGYVTIKQWSGSKRTAFYILSEDVCLEQRLSHYASTMHAETNKCSNCAQSFLESLTPAPGFCSIDCKTNALISQADSARIRKFVH
ncbi:Lateral signaling target protein 2, partial [Globisporangium splendens]